MISVLHVPYTYFPDGAGGTEVYVAGLVAALQRRGLAGIVAAPGQEDSAYAHGGVPVYRLAIEPRPDPAQAYGAPDRRVAAAFHQLVARVRPQIVHLHARTAAVSGLLVDAAHANGAKVVFTYHTPTVSCARGTMLRLGRSPCDGGLDARRCCACVLAAHGVPPVVRDAVARLPPAVGNVLAGVQCTGRAFTALRMPALLAAAQRRFHEFMRQVDRVVAVCGWAQDTLRLNGVPESKLVLCRQGLPRSGQPQIRMPVRPCDPGPGRALQVGFFGRLDRSKGIDTLIDALRLIPEAPVRLQIFSVPQPGSEAYARELDRRAAADARIGFQPALPPDAVPAAIGCCDIVAVPSRGLETGPLVVLEAFAAGVPVLGSRLGGIAELVEDEVDGILLSPDAASAWAAAISRLAERPADLARLRAGIRPPRTADDVADDMSAVYRDVLG